MRPEQPEDKDQILDKKAEAKVDPLITSAWKTKEDRNKTKETTDVKTSRDKTGNKH